MSEVSVSSAVAGGGGANKGHGSTAAKQGQLMERRISRKVHKSDERCPALWPSWVAGNDAPELKKANASIAVEGASDAAQGDAAIVLTGLGLSVFVGAIDVSRKIFQRMKNKLYPPHCVHVAASGLLLFRDNMR